MSDHHQNSQRKTITQTSNEQYYNLGDERGGGFIHGALNSGGMLNLKDFEKGNSLQNNDEEIQLEISLEDGKMKSSYSHGLDEALIAEFEASKKSCFDGKDLFRMTGKQNSEQFSGFQPLTLLEQEEIDKILKENNISPMKQSTIKQEQSMKFNFDTNFNFDYVEEEDEGEPLSSKQSTQQKLNTNEARQHHYVTQQDDDRHINKILDNKTEQSPKRFSTTKKEFTTEKKPPIKRTTDKKKSMTQMELKSSFMSSYNKSQLDQKLLEPALTQRRDLQKEFSQQNHLPSQKQNSQKPLEKKQPQQPAMKLDFLKKKMQEIKSRKGNDKIKLKRLKLSHIDDQEKNKQKSPEELKHIPWERQSKPNLKQIPIFNMIQNKMDLDTKTIEERVNHFQNEIKRQTPNVQKPSQLHLQNKNSESKDLDYKLTKLGDLTTKNDQTKDMTLFTSTQIQSNKRSISQSKQRNPSNNNGKKPALTSQYDKYQKKLKKQEELKNVEDMNKHQSEDSSLKRQQKRREDMSKLQQSEDTYSKRTYDDEYQMNKWKDCAIQNQDKKPNFKIPKPQLSRKINNKRCSTVQDIAISNKRENNNSAFEIRITEKISSNQSSSTIKWNTNQVKNAKQFQAIENKEKKLKSQIDKIQHKIDSKKKEGIAEDVKVTCIYKKKLNNIRTKEQKPPAVTISETSTNKSKLTIDQNKQKDESSSNISKIAQSENIQKENKRSELGYKQLNRINYSKIGINSYKQLPPKRSPNFHSFVDSNLQKESFQLSSIAPESVHRDLQINDEYYSDRSEIRAERAISQSRMNKFRFCKVLQNENEFQKLSESINEGQEINKQKKVSFFRSLTAGLEEERSKSPDQQNNQSIGDISSKSQSKLDLSKVVKSSETKYSRDDLIKIKERIQSISPQKITKSQLEIIQELVHDQSNKRVSFNEHNENENNIKKISMKQTNLECTFDPKKGQDQRSQTTLQQYNQQIIRKNKQHLQQVANIEEKDQQIQPTHSQNRSFYQSNLFQKLQERPLTSRDEIQKTNKTSLDICDERINKRKEQNQSIHHHEQLSVDSRNTNKSGIDFMTEARDFNNIISNLKDLLNKGQVKQQSKSYMTIQQRPNSNLMSQSHINNSYMTTLQNNERVNPLSMIIEHHDPKRSHSNQSMPIIGLRFTETVKHQKMATTFVESNLNDEKRKKDFDIKLQREIRAVESILTKKHQELKGIDTSMNVSIMARHTPNSRSISSCTQDLRAMSFGPTQSSKTHKGHSTNKSIVNLSTSNNFQPQTQNVGALLGTIQEAEAQLELLQNESNKIEQEIHDLRKLRSPPPIQNQI